MQKKCPHCERVKDIREFYVRSDTGRASSWCKRCIIARSAERQREDPARHYANRIRSVRRRRYGLEDAEYQRLLTEQGGLCAICHEDSNGHGVLHVDHDHDTGRVRGLLCFRCNSALGGFKDDPALLRAAVAYLSAPK